MDTTTEPTPKRSPKDYAIIAAVVIAVVIAGVKAAAPDTNRAPSSSTPATESKWDDVRDAHPTANDLTDSDLRGLARSTCSLVTTNQIASTPEFGALTITLWKAVDDETRRGFDNDPSEFAAFQGALLSTHCPGVAASVFSG